MRPRIRTIKPEFWDSEVIGRVSIPARLCFLGLFSMADDEGRIKGSARRVWKIVFGFDEIPVSDVDAMLNELVNQRLLRVYEVESEGGQVDECMLITGWKEHQRVDKPRASQIPHPDDDSKTIRERSRGVEKTRRGPEPDPDRIPTPLFPAKSPGAGAPKKVKMKSPEEWEAEKVSLMAVIPGPLQMLVEDMIELLASQNKTGTMALSRGVREIVRPASKWLSADGVDLDAARRGLDGALAKGIPNVGYAKKVSESTPRGRERAKQAPSTYSEIANALLKGTSSD